MYLISNWQNPHNWENAEYLMTKWATVYTQNKEITFDTSVHLLSTKG